MQQAYTEQKQDRILRAYAGTGDEEDKCNLHWCGLNRLDEVELGQLFNLRLTVQKMDSATPKLKAVFIRVMTARHHDDGFPVNRSWPGSRYCHQKLPIMPWR